MKTKFFTIAIALSSVVAMAQKKEIKNAEKAIEDGNYAEAKAQLSSVESLISAEKDKVQADFYYLKGLALIGMNNTNTQEVIEGGNALSKAAALGNNDAEKAIEDLKTKLVNSAIANNEISKYKKAADELFIVYQLDKKDTINLYYAAGSAVNAKEYDIALKYYQELQKLDYKGKKLVYTAKNKETGEIEPYKSANQRDVYIKAGTHSDPGIEREESKKPEIVKNIALIYIQKGEEEKAMQAIKEARKENPTDTALILAEADVYYKSGNTEKYNSLIQEVIKLDPNNATLYYNLGVSTSNAGDPEKAVEFYKKAIALNPEMTNAYINLSSAILAKEQPIIEEMNNLGMSTADNKRYEALQKQRKDLYRSAIPYLEKVIEKQGENVNESIIQTLAQIYMFLGEEEKAKALKN